MKLASLTRPAFALRIQGKPMRCFSFLPVIRSLRDGGSDCCSQQLHRSLNAVNRNCDQG
jgi:hypothetical protein